MVDDAPVRRVTRWRVVSNSGIFCLNLSLLHIDFSTPARASRARVLLLGNINDQVRIVSFELLDEGGKLGEWGVIHFGVLFLISECVLLPSGLNIAGELCNESPIVLSTLSF